ncbi:unnamed protein product [Acanthosepion pharaonis]|uniref:Uncharacterized protein n=1 Tax=Acanthosepion pharaonis TaxID=158019 RepID=A0A812AZT7_ACAPH|nr:unnamed protein product [Sepia pharaonis]
MNVAYTCLCVRICKRVTSQSSRIVIGRFCPRIAYPMYLHHSSPKRLLHTIPVDVVVRTCLIFSDHVAALVVPSIQITVAYTGSKPPSTVELHSAVLHQGRRFTVECCKGSDVQSKAAAADALALSRRCFLVDTEHLFSCCCFRLFYFLFICLVVFFFFFLLFMWHLSFFSTVFLLFLHSFVHLSLSLDFFLRLFQYLLFTFCYFFFFLVFMFLAEGFFFLHCFLS